MTVYEQVHKISPNALKPVKIGHHEFLINRKLGYYPYFSISLRNRIKRKLASNIFVTGEGGIGKTYLGSDICRVISPKYFDIDHVVFRYDEFLKAVNYSRMGTPIEFDEPSYAMSKKTWYKELQKALVNTIESFRFKVHPLFIPVINQALIDKDVRNYLIQFHIVVHNRGVATVYRRYASPFKTDVYNYEFCKLKYGLFDNNLCDKDSCIGCKKLDPRDTADRCMIFRAQYERKKAKTQEERYEQAIVESEKKETQNLSLEEIEAKAMIYFDKFYDKDKKKIDIELMNILLRRKHGIRLGHNKAYRVARAIQYDNPQYFEPDDE